MMEEPIAEPECDGASSSRRQCLKKGGGIGVAHGDSQLVPVAACPRSGSIPPRPSGRWGGQAARRNGRRAQRSATAWSRSSVPFTTEVRTFSIKCAPLGDQRICC
jgi:hypothetical protein